MENPEDFPESDLITGFSIAASIATPPRMANTTGGDKESQTAYIFSTSTIFDLVLWDEAASPGHNDNH